MEVQASWEEVRLLVLQLEREREEGRRLARQVRRQEVLVRRHLQEIRGLPGGSRGRRGRGK